MEKKKVNKLPGADVADGILNGEEWALAYMIERYFGMAFKIVEKILTRCGFGHDYYSMEDIAWEVMLDLSDALEKGFPKYLEHFKL